MIEFGEWLPDQSDLASGGVLEAKMSFLQSEGIDHLEI